MKFSDIYFLRKIDENNNYTILILEFNSHIFPFYVFRIFLENYSQQHDKITSKSFHNGSTTEQNKRNRYIITPKEDKEPEQIALAGNNDSYNFIIFTQHPVKHREMWLV